MLSRHGNIKQVYTARLVTAARKYAKAKEALHNHTPAHAFDFGTEEYRMWKMDRDDLTAAVDHALASLRSITETFFGSDTDYVHDEDDG